MELFKEFDFYSRKKIFFLVPAVILAIALICGIVYHFVFGSVFNKGFDYTGGYRITVTLYGRAEGGDFDDYKQEVKNIAEGLKDENGKSYGLQVIEVLKGDDDNGLSYIVRYVGGDDDAGDALKQAYQDKYMTGDYGEYGANVSDVTKAGGALSYQSYMFIALSIFAAFVLFFIYFTIRFGAYGILSAAFALICDLVMTAALTLVFRIPVGTSFIAAMIFAAALSVINSLSIVDKIKENDKLYSVKRVNNRVVKPEFVSEISLRDNFMRTVSLAAIALAVILLPVIIAPEPMKMFLLPALIGLVSSVFTSVFITPSFWAMLKKHFAGLSPRAKKEIKEAKETKEKQQQQELN